MITITVAETGGSGTPTGKVNLSIDGGGTAYSNGGSTTSVTLGASGTATYTANFASAGVHTIIAQYAGDATHAASTGSAVLTVGGNHCRERHLQGCTIAIQSDSEERLTAKRDSDRDACGRIHRNRRSFVCDIK